MINQKINTDTTEDCLKNNVDQVYDINQVYSNNIWVGWYNIFPNWVQCLYDMVPIVIFCAAFLYMYSIFFFYTVDGVLNMAALTGLFYEIEGEASSATDTRLLIDQVALASTFFLTLFSLAMAYPKEIACAATINAVTWCIYILLLPTAVSIIFGSYILNYLKGDTDSNSLLYAGLFDLTALFGFITRFVIQTIRYALIYIKMCMYVVCLEKTLIVAVRIDELLKVRERPMGIFNRMFDDLF